MSDLSAADAPSAQRQFLWKVAGIPGYWANKSGGEVAADVGKVYDGGNLRPSNLPGPAETGNITLSRPFRPSHRAIIRRLRGQVGRYVDTVSGQDTDRDLVAIGAPDPVYPNALLVRLADPDHDAASADAGTWELEFAVEGAED